MLVLLSVVGCFVSGVFGAQSSLRIFSSTLKSVNNAAKTSRYLLGVNAYTGLGALTDDNYLMDLTNKYGVNTISFAEVMSKSMMPTNQNDRDACCTTTTGLRKYIESGAACRQYTQSYTAKIWNSPYFKSKSNILPFIMMRDVCRTDNSPAIKHCYGPSKGAGVPKNEDGWWSYLTTAYVNCTLKLRPDLEYFHIWNEPNAVFYPYKKNGTYFAKFYQEVASMVKHSYPGIKIGGPVTWCPPSHSDTFEDYYVSLMEATNGKNTLDFFDYHAYDNKEQLSEWDVMLSNIHVLQLYYHARYGKKLMTHVTETSTVLSESQDNSIPTHWKSRVISNSKQIVALSHIPDKFGLRYLFDLNATTFEFLGKVDYFAHEVLRHMLNYPLVLFRMGGIGANGVGVFYDGNTVNQVVYNPSNNQINAFVVNGANSNTQVTLNDLDSLVTWSSTGQIARLNGNNNQVNVDSIPVQKVNGNPHEVSVSLNGNSVFFISGKYDTGKKPTKTIKTSEFQTNTNCMMQNFASANTWNCVINISENVGQVTKAYLKVGIFEGAVEYLWSFHGTFDGKHVVDKTGLSVKTRYFEIPVTENVLGSTGSFNLEIVAYGATNSGPSKLGFVSLALEHV